MKNAVILLSGGLDSTTCLAIAKHQGYNIHTLSISYGQKHIAELKAAQKIARHFEVSSHKIININLDNIGGSALTDKNIEVPDYQKTNNIPTTYVPARNTTFLSIALGFAEVIKAYDIFIGVSAVDYSGYPDCRAEYIQAFETLANLATKAGVEGHHIKIHTPLINLSKAQTIQEGIKHGVDYQMTVSCYQLNDDLLACQHCDSCVLRRKGFSEANLQDPTRYVG